MQYLFTAIFTKNEKGLLDVNFPDLPNCRTQGNNMVDAAKKAEAVLSLCLFDMEQHGISIPASRMPDEVKTSPGEIASMIKGDTDACHARFASSTELHTIEIPMWLAQMAKTSNLNISELLQNSIREEIGVPTQRVVVKPSPVSPPQAIHQPATTFTANTTSASPSPPAPTPVAVALPEDVIEVAPKQKEKKKKFNFFIPVAILVVLLIIAGSYILWNSDLAARVRNAVADNEPIAAAEQSNSGNPNNTHNSEYDYEPAYTSPPPYTPPPESEEDVHHPIIDDYVEELSPPPEDMYTPTLDDYGDDEPDPDIPFAHVGVTSTNINIPVVNLVGTNDISLASVINSSGVMTAGTLGPTIPESNIVIYGSNPGDGTQFSDLARFVDHTTLSNFVIVFDTGLAVHLWEIFSFYIDTTNFDFDTNTDSSFNMHFASLSMHPTDVSITENDRIITLITNRTPDGSERYVLHGRLP